MLNLKALPFSRKKNLKKNYSECIPGQQVTTGNCATPCQNGGQCLADLVPVRKHFKLESYLFEKKNCQALLNPEKRFVSQSGQIAGPCEPLSPEPHESRHGIKITHKGVLAWPLSCHLSCSLSSDIVLWFSCVPAPPNYFMCCKQFTGDIRGQVPV